MNERKQPTRRDFLKSAAWGAAALSVTSPTLKGRARTSAAPAQSPFKLKYAPPLGMFEGHAGKNLLDQLKFMADQGFRAMFDNGITGRPLADQEAIARETARLGLTIGPFVAYGDLSRKAMVLNDQSVRDMLAGKFKAAVEAGKRLNAKWALAVPGCYDLSMDWDYQTANVIENLKRCVGLVEPSGLVIVLEPLNPKDHPGLFLTKMAQAYQICRAVGSPCCKINDDIYHQQITEGNIIPNIDACWEAIGSFHLGDTPGRNEPGTGELNYRNIFKQIHSKGYQGVLCMEHGKSKPGKDGEKAVIEAYRSADDF